MQNEKEILKSALEHFGAESQTLMLFEEMAELQKELCKNARGRCNRQQIAEEIPTLAYCPTCGAIMDLEVQYEQHKYY